MKLFVKKQKELVLPTQANPDDAGYDLIATTPPKIVGDSIELPYDGRRAWSRIAYIEYGTNLYIAPQDEVKSHLDVVKDVNMKDAMEGFRKGDFFQENDILKYHTLLFPRSSISKKNLVLANSIGLIDNSYRGQIFVRFNYLTQPKDFVIVPELGIQKIYSLVDDDMIYQEGDKIVQIVAGQTIPISFELVDSLTDTLRNDGRFGSSDKKY